MTSVKELIAAYHAIYNSLTGVRPLPKVELYKLMSLEYQLEQKGYQIIEAPGQLPEIKKLA